MLCLETWRPASGRGRAPFSVTALIGLSFAVRCRRVLFEGDVGMEGEGVAAEESDTTLKSDSIPVRSTDEVASHSVSPRVCSSNNNKQQQDQKKRENQRRQELEKQATDSNRRANSDRHRGGVQVSPGAAAEAEAARLNQRKEQGATRSNNDITRRPRGPTSIPAVDVPCRLPHRLE